MNKIKHKVILKLNNVQLITLCKPLSSVLNLAIDFAVKTKRSMTISLQDNIQ